LQLPAHVVGSRPGFEFFYACPTLSAWRFFRIAAQVSNLQRKGGAQPSATDSLKRLSDLTASIQVHYGRTLYHFHMDSKICISKRKFSGIDKLRGALLESFGGAMCNNGVMPIICH
jgi:hypothetical protein